MTRIIALFFSLFLVTVPTALANNCAGYAPGNSLMENLRDCEPNRVITAEDYSLGEGARERVLKIADRLITVAAILAIGGIVISGIMYITSIGNEEKAKKAQEALIYSIIGFVVALLANFFINSIVNLIFSFR